MRYLAHNDFLMRIDDRYHSDSILRARAIIHKFSVEVPELSPEEITRKIQNKIMEMGNDANSSNDFIYLLNYLDFLETIAYFANNKILSTKQINELIGSSLANDYENFRPWIRFRRDKYKKSKFYIELERYVKNIES